MIGGTPHIREMMKMQMVIDISEDLYNECKRLGDKRDTLFEAIRNGTPLPKGHGRLIDADSFRKNIDQCTPFTKHYQDSKPILNFAKRDLLECLAKESTIIEADRRNEI